MFSFNAGGRFDSMSSADGVKGAGTWKVKDGKIETIESEYGGQKSDSLLVFVPKGEELHAEMLSSGGTMRVTYSLKKNMVMRLDRIHGYRIVPDK
jgi:hypothetical protein